MPGVFKIKNVEDAEFTLTHPDGAGAVSIASNNIAKIDAVSSALAGKANTADLKEIGVGQTWQNVTASRAVGVTYTNTTGKPIQVSIDLIPNSVSSNFTVNVNGIIAAKSSNFTNGYSNCASCYVVIPNNATYILSGATFTIGLWSELR